MSFDRISEHPPPLALERESQADAHEFGGKDGWEVARQRGSQIILVKVGHMATLSVPDHREIAKGTLRSLIRSSGLTVEEFAALPGK